MVRDGEIQITLAWYPISASIQMSSGTPIHPVVLSIILLRHDDSILTSRLEGMNEIDGFNPTDVTCKD